MAKFLSIQGTSSDSGKSFLTMALCRIFADGGYKVAPFKAQNMSSNADIVDGLEMARAQSIQAMAARIKPDVRMNPILLKPMGNYISKVVLLGKEYATMHAKEYYNNFLSHAFNHVLDAIKELEDRYEIIIIEGAGSAIEINLREEDIANMKLAKKVNASVIITADIDRGGAFASMLGTLALLDEE
ncbi:MAG: cobyric acid synthase CobQ, partial [Candidatus Nitrosothermus koennekii]